jgi:regulator of sigma E protease
MTVNARPVPTWESFLIEYVPRAGRDLQLEIDRAGTTQSVLVRPTAVGKYEFGYLGVSPVIRPKIAQVISGTPAERAGFQNGDVLLSVGGERGLAREQVIQKIRASAGAPLAFIVERAGQEVPISVVPEGAKGSATVGLSIQVHDQMVRIDPTLLEAFRMSAEQNWANAVLIGRTLKGLFTADTPVRQLVGPMGIAEMSGAAAEVGWVALFNLMAMISLNLGLLNLMPVPVLDGGHIAILAAEGLARRDFSVRVKERILMAGAAVVVLLMVTVLYNDFARLLR